MHSSIFEFLINLINLDPIWSIIKIKIKINHEFFIFITFELIELKEVQDGL